MKRSTKVWIGLIGSVLIGACEQDKSVTPKGSAHLDDTKAVVSVAAKSKFPFTIVDVFEVGPGVYVRSLAVDQQRNALWVGTSIGALEIDLNQYTVKQTITRANGLANEYVFHVTVGRAGDVWFGTNGGGISHLNQHQWKTYFPLHGLADYWVYSAVERGTEVWIGTWAGLSQFNPQTQEFKTYLKELVNEWVYGLAVDKKNQLWVATEGGINSFDGKQWRVWTHREGLGAPNQAAYVASTNTGLGTRARHDLSVLQAGKPTYNPNYIFCVLADKKDQIWAGTWGGGLARYDGVSWQNTTTAAGLGGDIVYSLAEDSQGRIWAGTNGGLSVQIDSRWINLDQSQGLVDNHVYAVTSQNNGQIWVGLRGAVVRLAPK